MKESRYETAKKVKTVRSLRRKERERVMLQMEANVRDYKSGYRETRNVMEINMEEWQLRGIYF